MQLFFNLFDFFCRCIISVDQFYVLLKARIHIIGINLFGVDYDDMTVYIIRDFGNSGTVAARLKQLFITLYKNEVGCFIKKKLNFLVLACISIFVSIDMAIPLEALNLSGIEIIVELPEQLRKFFSFRYLKWQLFKIANVCRLKQVSDLLIDRVHILNIFGKPIYK